MDVSLDRLSVVGTLRPFYGSGMVLMPDQSRHGTGGFYGGRDSERNAHVSCRDGLLRVEWVPGEAEVSDLMDALGARHVTRVDVALDFDSDLSEYEWMHSRRKSNKHYSHDGRLETVYLGRRSSEKMVRVYNKTVEQGLDDGLDRWRVECQHRPSATAEPLPVGLFAGVRALPRVISSSMPVRDAEKLALAQVSPEHYYRLDLKTRTALEARYGEEGLPVSPEVLYAERRPALRESLLEAVGL